MRPVLISGPSGIGKSTLTRYLIQNHNFKKIITATTRIMRDGEENGRDYYFLSPEEFEFRAKKGEFFMDNSFLGARYGTPTSEVESILRDGFHPIMETFITTVGQFKARFPNTIGVYLLPDSLEQISARMRMRGDNEDSIERRISAAKREIELYVEIGTSFFDHTIVVGTRPTEEIAFEVTRNIIDPNEELVIK